MSATTGILRWNPKNHLITDYSLDNSTIDYASLINLAEGTKDLIGDFDLSAYKRYFSLTNLERFDNSHIKAFMPSSEYGMPDKETGIPAPAYHMSRFNYDPFSDTYTCLQGHRMHCRFVQPNSSRPKYRIYPH